MLTIFVCALDWAAYAPCIWPVNVLTHQFRATAWIHQEVSCQEPWIDLRGYHRVISIRLVCCKLLDSISFLWLGRLKKITGPLYCRSLKRNLTSRCANLCRILWFPFSQYTSLSGKIIKSDYYLLFQCRIYLNRGNYLSNFLLVGRFHSWVPYNLAEWIFIQNLHHVKVRDFMAIF